MSLARFTARKLNSAEVKALVDSVLSVTVGLPELEEVILFGSAACDQMDEGSDLDFVYLFTSEPAARAAQKKIYSLKPRLIPCDLICVDRNRFEDRSRYGGVLFVARTEGKIIYRRTDGTIQEKI